MSDIEDLKILVKNYEDSDKKKLTNEQLEKWYREDFLPLCKEKANKGETIASAFSIRVDGEYLYFMHHEEQVTSFLKGKGFKQNRFFKDMFNWA